MRSKQVFKKISVTEELYNRIQKDKLHFQEIIGGGKWSVSDTLVEYLKIMYTDLSDEGRKLERKRLE